MVFALNDEGLLIRNESGLSLEQEWDEHIPINNRDWHYLGVTLDSRRLQIYTDGARIDQMELDIDAEL